MPKRTAAIMREWGTNQKSEGQHVSAAGQARARAQVPDEREIKGNHRTCCGMIRSNICFVVQTWTLFVQMVAILYREVGKKRSPWGWSRDSRGRWDGKKADNRKTGDRLSRGLDFLKNHRKPLQSFKQETSMIQLMIEIDDFGRGAGKRTLSRDRRRRQQMD